MCKPSVMSVRVYRIDPQTGEQQVIREGQVLPDLVTEGPARYRWPKCRCARCLGAV